MNKLHHDRVLMFNLLFIVEISFRSVCDLCRSVARDRKLCVFYFVTVQILIVKSCMCN